MKKLYFTTTLLFLHLLTTAQTTSTEVGVTEGALTVSLSGASNYMLPIAVPSWYRRCNAGNRACLQQ
jgi:hypothetical protein